MDIPEDWIMSVVTIKSVEIKSASGEILEIAPEIPFSEFPVGPREAGPDESGNLVWCVNIAD